MHSKTDPVKLSADLIRCKSVTPNEGGAIDLLTSLLTSEGFNCYRIEREGISNLFAIWGENRNGKTIGFNGHTDVVPTFGSVRVPSRSRKISVSILIFKEGGHL